MQKATAIRAARRLAGLRVAGVLALPPPALLAADDGAGDDPDPNPDEDLVGDHLTGNHQPGNGDRMVARTWKAIDPISIISPMTSHVDGAPGGGTIPGSK